MDLLLWMLFGGITAWIASITAGRKLQGQYMIAGVAGAVMAGLAMQNLTGKSQQGINYFSLIVSVAGSLLLVGLVMYISLQEQNKR